MDEHTNQAQQGYLSIECCVGTEPVKDRRSSMRFRLMSEEILEGRNGPAGAREGENG